MSTANVWKIDLTSSPITSSLVKFSLPLLVSFLVNLLYTFIDRYFVSSLGTDAIAAIGLSEQLNFLVFTLGSGFCMGTGIIVARRIGEGDKDNANIIATQAVIFMIGATICLTVLLFLALPYAIGTFDSSLTVKMYSQQYLSAILLGFTGNLVSFQINAIIRSTGNPVYPTIILLTTTVINAILAPIFIFIFQWGMYGAGLATALAQLTGALINIYSLLSGRSGIVLQLHSYRFDWSIIKKVIMLGLPSSLQMMSVSITRIFIFKIVGAYGVTVMAAYTLGLQIDFVVFMFVFALGVAIEIATGQNIGAKKYDRVMQYYKSAVSIIGVIILVLGIVIWFAGNHLIGIYTKDELVLKTVLEYLHISVFGYIFFAIGIISARVISGAGAAFCSLFIVAGSILLLQLPLVYILSHYTSLGQVGIWTGAALGYVLFSLIGFISVKSNLWMKVRI